MNDKLLEGKKIAVLVKRKFSSAPPKNA